MNRHKLDLVYKAEEQQLVLKLNGFVVLSLWYITKIKKGEGWNEGEVNLFSGDKHVGDIWDVNKIEEL